MPDLKGELKEQIIEEIQLDSLIQKHINKLDEKHKSEIEDTGTYADWFPYFQKWGGPCALNIS